VDIAKVTKELTDFCFHISRWAKVIRDYESESLYVVHYKLYVITIPSPKGIFAKSDYCVLC
jgi:hypothetical protein